MYSASRNWEAEIFCDPLHLLPVCAIVWNEIIQQEEFIMCNNFCGNGFDCWWIIIFIVLICCCGCGNSMGGNSCGCGNNSCGCGNNSCDCC